MSILFGKFTYETQYRKKPTGVKRAVECAYTKGQEQRAWDRIKERDSAFYKGIKIEYIRTLSK